MHYLVLLMTIIALLVSGVSSSQDAQDVAKKSPQSSEKKIVVEDEKEPSAPVPKAFDPIRTIGMDLPDVEVKNIEGEIVRLSDFKDKTMVLEFAVPSCRFIQRLYIQKRVQPMIRRWEKQGVPWYTIDSTFFCHPQRWLDWKENYSVAQEFLLDPEAKLAESIGVSVSPTYVVVHKGKIVYHGAIDDDIWGQNLNRKLLLDETLKKIVANEDLGDSFQRPYGSAIRTRKVEDQRREEIKAARRAGSGKPEKGSEGGSSKEDPSTGGR